jgi:hypothetical protein
MFNQKFKVMKNLMQKLVKAILCFGVVSVSLIACESDTVEDNVIQLDQIDQLLDDQLQLTSDSIEADSIVPEDVIEVELLDEVVGDEELKEEE